MNNNNKFTNWFKFNVGGETFLTSKLSIEKEPKSFLYRLVQDEELLKTCKDENGAYMIDRDPRYFPIILNYLRHGKVVIDGNLCEEGVLEEAEFYNITGIIDKIKSRQKEREENLNNNVVRSVYRVLQCSEDELARTISSMSDGWKFEQMVSIGSNYCYKNEDRPEFICIVSKECPINISKVPRQESTERVRMLQEQGSRT